MDWRTLLLGALLGAIFGAIVGIPIAYFINLTSPSLGDYLKARSLSIRERKLASIENEYHLRKGSKEYPETATGGLVLELVIAIWRLTYLIAGIGIFILILLIEPLPTPLIRNIIFLIGIGFIAIQAYRITSHLKKSIGQIVDVVSFDSYRERTKARIKKLGGNPEMLDKLDEEKFKHETELNKLLSEIEQQKEEENRS